MKIYNEIVIDMNPESSSYGETLHEDSFEYEGDMMLMQDRATLQKGANAYYTHEETGARITSTEYNALASEKSPTNPAQQGQGRESYDHNLEYPIWEQDESNNWVNTGEFSSTELPSHYASLSDAPAGTFTYTEGEFDPTSTEFKTSIEETGGLEELAAGYGMEGTDFEEFYGKPLEFWEQEYGAEGTLEMGRELETETLAENLRAATTAKEIGEASIGIQAGRSLFDIKQQTDVATASSGFATSGAIASGAKRAQKGIFQDYTLQQKELASAMTGATTAFDIGERGVDIDATQAGIDYKRKVADFWKTTEDQFYQELGTLEELENA